MNGAVLCTADRVIHHRECRCGSCQELVVSIVVKTGKTTRAQYLAHFDANTQTYVRHECGRPMRAAA